VTAHGDVRERKWRGNWRMEWVASTLHTISKHVVSSTTTADTHISAASSRLNLRSRRFKWTRPFRWKTKFGFCACAITFQLASTWLASRSRRFSRRKWLQVTLYTKFGVFLSRSDFRRQKRFCCLAPEPLQFKVRSRPMYTGCVFFNGKCT